jgi:uncharacterized membrane protein
MKVAYTGAAVLFLAMTGLSGCATLSEGECRTADWYEIGRNDGAAGHARDRLHAHAEACSRFGILPDTDSYYSGRDEGLARYCTPESAYRVGRGGSRYQGVCPTEAEDAFLAAYRDGRAVYGVEQELRRVERALDRLENRLASDRLDDEIRRSLRQELRSLDREYRSINRELIRVERDAARRLTWLQ